MPSGAVFEIHVEDFYHALVPPERWGDQESRVMGNMVQLLALLDAARIRAHCFLLGHVAEHYPELVWVLRKEGHLIGSHGYWHRYGEREGDVSDRRARHWIGEPVVDYRSPFWSTTPRPNFAGGFFFRTMPLWWILKEVQRTQVFYLHPHDLDAECPVASLGVVGSLVLRRTLGTRRSIDKLWTVIQKVQWRNPTTS